MSNIKYDFNAKPLLKALLHCSKHPTCCVNGLFIGEQHIPSNLDSDSNISTIIDCIPLFHNSLNVSLPLEIALSMISMSLTEIPSSSPDKKFHIIGYYEASDNYHNNVLSSYGKTLCNKLAEISSINTIPALVLDCRLLKLFMAQDKDFPFKIYGRKENGNKSEYELLNDNVINIECGTKLGMLFNGLLEEGEYKNINDFDDHLDDISKDFLNKMLIL